MISRNGDSSYLIGQIRGIIDTDGAESLDSAPRYPRNSNDGMYREAADWETMFSYEPAVTST